jgi:hypothetical protein
MTKQYNIGLIASSLQIIIIAVWHLVPDLFLNPINGAFRSLSYLTKEAILIPHAQLDDVTCYSMGVCGIGALVIGSISLLASTKGDHLLKKEAFRARLWLAGLSAHVFAHAAFVYDLVGIDKIACIFWAGFMTANFIWALWHSRHIAKRNQDHIISRTKSTPLQLMTVWVDCIFCGLWGATLMWNPHSLEPAAGNPMAHIKATPKGDNTFLDCQLLTTRLQGVPVMVFALCMLELLLFDRSVEAIRANNRFALFSTLLYSLFFVHYALYSENANRTGIAVGIMSNAGLAAFIMQCGPNVCEGEEPAKALAKHVKDALLAKEPELIAETKTKKKVN